MSIFYRNLKTEFGVFDVTPTTYKASWTLGGDYPNFVKRYRALQIGQGMCKEESMPAKHCKSNLWILKPVTTLAGRNIHLFKKIDEISEFLVK